MSQDFMIEMQQVFLEEARALLAELEGIFLAQESTLSSGRGIPQDDLDRVFRNAHNLKGSAASVGFTGLTQLAHAMEDLFTLFKNGTLTLTSRRCSIVLRSIDEFRSYVEALAVDPNTQRPLDRVLSDLKAASLPETERPPEATAAESPSSAAPAKATPAAGSQSEKTIRVGTEKLDSLLNLIGELVVNQSMMISHRVNQTTHTEHAVQTLTYMEKLVGELQTLAMTLRMVPIKPLFQKMARVIRDASVALDKKVVFETDGDHVELDKTVLDLMTDPLTHIIRNAVDHGVDDAPERQAAGKRPEATITLRAIQKDDQILIEVRDDGRGLNREKIIKKAVSQGILDAERSKSLTDSEVYRLIFLPGFSTKEQVTDLSGRGVGMDVVQRAVRDLKGEIFIDSTLGKGTTFTIALPLSLSIIPGLVVSVDQEKYVIPISQLSEIIEVQKFDVRESTQRGRMIDLRGEVIPVHRLSSLLHGRSGCKVGGRAYAPGVVISQHGRKATYEVDEIIGQQQIVIKKLGVEIMAIQGILGGAVLSNGEPAMILDLGELSGAVTTEGGKHVAA